MLPHVTTCHNIVQGSTHTTSCYLWALHLTGMSCTSACCECLSEKLLSAFPPMTAAGTLSSLLSSPEFPCPLCAWLIPYYVLDIKVNATSPESSPLHLQELPHLPPMVLLKWPVIFNLSEWMSSICLSVCLSLPLLWFKILENQSQFS
jgi:hypothetical protein